jgi:hypothetical protein
MVEAGLTQRSRIALAVLAALSTLAAGLVLLADSARSGITPTTELLPDLVVERPDELYVTRNGAGLRLKLSNTVANVGIGPLEILPGDASDDCTKGDIEGRFTLQAIYEDSSDAGSAGFFRRSEDSDQAAPEPAGCSRYHPKHDHWHFDNFARYSLYLERTGRLAGVSRKVSFCVIDTGNPYPALDGSPGGSSDPDGPGPYYPQNPAQPKFPTCSAESIDGLSIGWEDTYSAGLPGQGLKIDPIRRATYCLVLEVDPATGTSDDGVLRETDEGNNARFIRVRLRPRHEELRRLPGGCDVPA